uniref:DUF4336 domain-containing protein n=1 Tax=Chromera velia CCMP2878 TaxID=1169474 RepID=A0A0G4F7M5_9ALVE|eukprot:Cvel_15480.t1-p1 / transcript=Cvel_15480.t1 / gene=Cvel_15480 / organism=Chromera_velia_CCMP2878 / gene_product=hypothetical protein / transcript_product=hypothetical protein / location=Cvel_scaffold1148:16437-18546(-) / protein_length=333 / sequence_SO=supercontig / SO=protein_coding / is_pseudo=false
MGRKVVSLSVLLLCPIFGCLMPGLAFHLSCHPKFFRRPRPSPPSRSPSPRGSLTATAEDTRSAREKAPDEPGVSSESAEPLQKTWSNQKGEVLCRVTDSIWYADRPFIWNKIDVGGKMAVVRLRDGTLWVHSPVAFDRTLAEALGKAGRIKHLVSPNFEHVKFAGDWKREFPSSVASGCPGLAEREPGVGFDQTVPVVGEGGEGAPSEWLGEFEVCFLDFEHNPFTRRPFFNEVIFFHKPSKTLIVSDALWNYPGQPERVPLLTRVWKLGMDKLYFPFYENFMIKDEAGFERARRKIFSWGVERIIPCHGDVVEGRGECLNLLQQFFGKPPSA